MEKTLKELKEKIDAAACIRAKIALIKVYEEIQKELKMKESLKCLDQQT